jgi:hypothetical protein
MGKKLSPPDEELYRRTDEVLHYIWDPIGVSEAPTARDEYYSYLPQVFDLVKESSSAGQIADYLFQVATERMGLNGNRAHDIRVAEVLLDWKQVIFEKHS